MSLTSLSLNVCMYVCNVLYRHVILPRSLAKRLPSPARLLAEAEWRGIGVQQSRGWVHYEIHKPEPHILLFRRPLGTDPRTGQASKCFFVIILSSLYSLSLSFLSLEV